MKLIDADGTAAVGIDQLHNSSWATLQHGTRRVRRFLIRRRGYGHVVNSSLMEV
jgi:hypothetical protein